MSLRYSILWTLGLIASLVGCQREPPSEAEVPRPARVMLVGDASAIAGRAFPGRASATQEVNLSFRVSGPLIALPIGVGDVVESGDLLSRIDPRDYESQLRNAKGQLQRAQANAERAESDLRRSLGIQRNDPGAISAAVIDRAQEALALAEADIVALDATLGAARDAVADTYLTAPFGGVIVATNVENHEYVQAQQPIARLLDQSRVEFLINIPETLISLVGQVENVQVTFDAFPELAIPAEIKEIGTEASIATRTYPVTLIMDQPASATILPGMAGVATGKIRDPNGSTQVPIIVPAHAIFSPTDSQASYVWVIEDDETVQQREVELGLLTSTGVTIEAGLENGERIAIAGVHFLSAGQRIRPLTD